MFQKLLGNTFYEKKRMLPEPGVNVEFMNKLKEKLKSK